MNKTQDIHAINLNNNYNSLMIDENKQNVTYLLTQKVNQVTETQMKKIEVQKIEDNLTIKTLEREYLEEKQNFTYSKQKLEETQKKASAQSEMINQLLQANKAIIEKFNELQRFQGEFILVNVNNAEKTSIKCIKKKNELSNTFQIIIEREHYSKFLNKNIHDKKNKMNSDVQKKVKDRKDDIDNINKVLIQSKKKLEILKIQLIQDKINNNFEEFIETKNKKIFDLELNEKIFKKQLKQEIAVLNQENKKNIQILDSNNRNLKEKKELLSKLESDLFLIEKNKTSLNKILQSVQCKHKAILTDIMKKQATDELSKQAFSDSIKNINNEQNLVNNELEITKNKFSKHENNMHSEFNSLVVKLEKKKKLIMEIEDYQQDLNTFKKTKQVKQKELSNNRELQFKFKQLNDELKKYEEIILNNNKKQSELDAKIEYLEENKNNIKQKLEFSKNEEIQIDIIEKQPKEINVKYTEIDKKLTQSVNKKKIIYSTNKTELEFDKTNIILNSPRKTKMSPPTKSIYSFDLDETDESDDELNIKITSPKKLTESNINFQKIGYYKADKDEQNNIKINQSLSQSNKLFDDLLSREASKLSKTPKDTNLFKMPQTYITPIKNKSHQPKKYS